MITGGQYIKKDGKVSYSKEYLKKAHKHSFKNMEEFKASTKGGCFCCLSIFDSTEETGWVEERDGKVTVLCPYCSVDSVIGDKSGYPIDEQFLKAMQKEWFGG